MASPTSVFTAGTRAEPLPPGRHGLSRDLVVASQRGRLLEALARCVAEMGYAETTIAHVVARARVSRRTFYEHFATKEDCFVATYDTAVAYLLGRLRETSGAGGDWETRLDRSLACYLEVLSEEPAFARTVLVEVHAAGPAALARRAAVHARFEGGMRRLREEIVAGRGRGEPLPDSVYEAIVLGIVGVATARVRAGELAALPALKDELVAFVRASLQAP